MRYLIPPLLLISSLVSSGIASAAVDAGATPSVDIKYDNSIQNITEFKQKAALDLAKKYDEYSLNLKSNINEYQLTINANDAIGFNSRKKEELKERLSITNKAVREAKGLNTEGDNLIQLRMASKAMLKSWQNGEDPLFAYAPAGDDKTWTTVEAYDKNGQVHYLDAHTLPERPVFVVELDGKQSLREGIQLMRSMLLKNRIGGMEALVEGASLTKAEQFSAHVLKYIRLNDDEEPWVSGDAEIYAITTGVSPSRKAPVLDIVDMPYLDGDGKDYYPNQILIHWNRYRWKAADVLLMEHDDNTNYKTLASKLLSAAEEIMKKIPDQEIQSYSFIPKITNSVLEAMPDQWFINTDDYVDTFYTLLESETYTRHYGARGNAQITLQPLNISER